MTHRHRILSRGLKRTRGDMNRTEAAYAELLAADAEVLQWWFEPFTFRLSHPRDGQPLRYTPDFLVLGSDGTTYIDDAKASFRDLAGDVRVKAAAELFPLWVFRLAIQQPKKNGGGFVIKEV